MLPYIDSCSFNLHEDHDSTGPYHVGWETDGEENVETEINPWVYRSIMDLDGVPYPGDVRMIICDCTLTVSLVILSRLVSHWRVSLCLSLCYYNPLKHVLLVFFFCCVCV